MLETDLPNRRILMHLYNARYQQRDEFDPYDLRRMRDGINVAEGTLPISLEELYEKEKAGGASRSMLSIEQLLEQLKKRRPEDAQLQPNGDQQALLVSVGLHGLCPDWRASRDYRHRRETSFGFAVSLVIGVFYFLFIIIADTLRRTRSSIPSCWSGSRTCSLSC